MPKHCDVASVLPMTCAAGPCSSAWAPVRAVECSECRTSTRRRLLVGAEAYPATELDELLVIYLPEHPMALGA